MGASSLRAPSTSGAEGISVVVAEVWISGKVLTNLLLITLSPAHQSSCWGSKRSPAPRGLGVLRRQLRLLSGFQVPLLPSCPSCRPLGRRQLCGTNPTSTAEQEGCCGGEGGRELPWLKAGWCSDTGAWATMGTLRRGHRSWQNVGNPGSDSICPASRGGQTRAVVKWAGQQGACHRGELGLCHAPHHLLHPPFPGRARSEGKGFSRVSNVTATLFPSITRPPSGETLCLGCSYPVTEPCAGLSPSDLLQRTKQSQRGDHVPAGHRHQGVTSPRGDGRCPRQRAPDPGAQGRRAWGLGKDFAHSAPGSCPKAGLQRWGWQGGAHLPGGGSSAGNCLCLCQRA